MIRILIVFSLLAALLVAAPAAANDTVSDGRGGQVEVFPMVFPVDGPNHYSDTWGACRGSNCSRSHIGVDIMAADGIPVLAAADGVVTRINWEQRAERVNDSRCCTISIEHAGGWVSNYLHLNHLPGHGVQTVAGWGVVDGLLPGVEVKAGQLIGWVGHSGNASAAYPHLHFELIKDGVAVNPHPHVERATEPGFDGRFSDTRTTVHREDIEAIAALGITRGCNPPANTRYCPDLELTRGEVAAMLTRALELPRVDADAFADDTAHLFEGDIDALAAVGIAFGCTEDEFCADRELRRDEMARFLVNAFGYPATDTDAFGDDAGDFEADINALAAVGVTRGCNPPDNTSFCPDRTLTRAEFASFMVRALDRR